MVVIVKKSETKQSMQIIDITLCPRPTRCFPCCVSLSIAYAAVSNLC